VEISKWMKRSVITAKPRDTIRHARELMEQHRVNQLPVVRNGRLLGIITDRDVRDAFPSVFDQAAPGKSTRVPDQVTVENVMTANVLTLGPQRSVADAARLMRRERIGAVPIVEGETLVGIFTRSDVLDAFVALADEADVRR
jgi:acetoin utilization protein AcuB